MAIRNKTYITYHDDFSHDIKADDVMYVKKLLDWKIREQGHISFINAKEKAAAIADESRQLSLVHAIKERLANATNLLLIMKTTAKEDTPWVRFEIEWAVDHCKIPIIAAYLGYDSILAPANLEHHWPHALGLRIKNASAQAVHVPFIKDPVQRALGQFNRDNQPKGGLSAYTQAAYERWGLGN